MTPITKNMMPLPRPRQHSLVWPVIAYCAMLPITLHTYSKITDWHIAKLKREGYSKDQIHAIYKEYGPPLD